MSSSIKDTYVKHNLGKVLKLYLFLTLTVLFAEDFSHSFKLNNSSPYVKEPVILTLDLNQTNHDIVLLFDFDLKKSDNYFFQRLDLQETDTHHDTKIKYTYLIYPLKEGKIEIDFDLTKKITNDESVAYSFSGDRDNVKTLETQDSKITLPPLTLNVQSLPKETVLVGDFNIHVEFKKHTAKAYEPLPLQILLKGEGYPPLLSILLPKSDHYTLFQEKAIVTSQHSRTGTRSTVVYPMALSASKSFDLEPVALKAFNPQTKKIYTLTIPAQHFDISREEVAVLVDKSDDPPPFHRDWDWLTSLLGYLTVFASGYLTAMVWKRKKQTLLPPSDPFKEKIAACKSEKELLQLLMARDSKKFLSSIEKLEKSLYKKGKIDLKQVKKEAQESL